jgi:hypothetical protein
MDVRLFCAVVWRFYWLVLGGLVLGGLLAIHVYNAGSKSQTWQSQAELIITQESFPYGRAVQQYSGGSTKTGAPASPVGNQSYMSSLSPIYANIANGNDIQQSIHQLAPVTGTVTASAVTDPATSTDLPFVLLTATSSTAADASRLAVGAATVLTRYVTQQQEKAGVAPADRVLLGPVQTGQSAQLISHQKLSTPLLIFVAIACATFGLAFILENAKPRTAVKLGRVPPETPPANGKAAPSNGKSPQTTRSGRKRVVRSKPQPVAREPRQR